MCISSAGQEDSGIGAQFGMHIIDLAGTCDHNPCSRCIFLLTIGYGEFT